MIFERASKGGQRRGSQTAARRQESRRAASSPAIMYRAVTDIKGMHRKSHTVTRTRVIRLLMGRSGPRRPRGAGHDGGQGVPRTVRNEDLLTERTVVSPARRGEQIQKARSHPWISPEVPVRGFVYDVRTGRLSEVFADRETVAG